MLHEVDAGASLSVEHKDKRTPAHLAAENGNEGCLRVLHEVGAGASLSAEDEDKYTPAHLAAQSGKHEVGAVHKSCTARVLL